jgi:hypothetical protein
MRMALAAFAALRAVLVYGEAASMMEQRWAESVLARMQSIHVMGRQRRPAGIRNVARG